MKLSGLFAFVALSLAFPAVAHAQDGAELDCVMATITPALQAEVGASMLGGREDPNRDRLKKQVHVLSDVCAAKAGFDRGVYFDYALGRIGRQYIGGELRQRFGLDAGVLDKHFDFRIGGANPSFDNGIERDQVLGLVGALKDAGVEVASLPKEAWTLVGAYLAANSQYWRKRQMLSN